MGCFVDFILSVFFHAPHWKSSIQNYLKRAAHKIHFEKSDVEKQIEFHKASILQKQEMRMSQKTSNTECETHEDEESKNQLTVRENNQRATFLVR
jgi:hypothetical protein